MRRIALLFCLIFIRISINAQHQEYSNVSNYGALEGLLLKAIKIERIGDSKDNFFGIGPIDTERYIIDSEIEVQVSCSVVSREFEKATARYLIEVGIDSSGLIRKKFSELIYNYWKSKDKSYLDDYQYLPVLNHIFYKNGDYVLYSDY